MATNSDPVPAHLHEAVLLIKEGQHSAAAIHLDDLKRDLYDHRLYELPFDSDEALVFCDVIILASRQAAMGDTEGALISLERALAHCGRSSARKGIAGETPDRGCQNETEDGRRPEVKGE